MMSNFAVSCAAYFHALESSFSKHFPPFLYPWVLKFTAAIALTFLSQHMSRSLATKRQKLVQNSVFLCLKYIIVYHVFSIIISLLSEIIVWLKTSYCKKERRGPYRTEVLNPHCRASFSSSAVWLLNNILGDQF